MKKKRFAFFTAIIAAVVVNGVVAMGAYRNNTWNDTQYNCTYDAKLYANKYIFCQHTMDADVNVYGTFSDFDLGCIRIAGGAKVTFKATKNSSVTKDVNIDSRDYDKTFSEDFEAHGWGLTNAGIEVVIERLDGRKVNVYCGD